MPAARGRRLAGAGRPRRQGRHPRRGPLRRAGAAALDRLRAGARPRGGVPRRADRRARPAGPAQPVGPAVRAQRLRPHGRADHALHGRGRGAVRPGRDHGPRPDPPARLAGRAGPRPRRADPDHRGPRPADRRDARGSPASTARTSRRTAWCSSPALRPPCVPGWPSSTQLDGVRSRPAPSRTSSSTSPAGSTAHEHRTAQPFIALSLAILQRLLRDRASVFFAIVFPLMFLVLFGGIFSDQDQSKVDLIQVGDVALVDDLPPGAKEAFDDTFEVTHTDDLDEALAEVRKGDADVAVEQQRRHAGRALHADRPGEGGDHPGHAARVRRRRQRRPRPASRRRTRLRGRAGRGRLADDHPVRHARPARLGGRDERRFGAAATLQGWRQTKLLRRLQLAPVSTRTVVGARVASRWRSRWPRWRSSWASAPPRSGCS